MELLSQAYSWISSPEKVVFGALNKKLGSLFTILCCAVSMIVPWCQEKQWVIKNKSSRNLSHLFGTQVLLSRDEVPLFWKVPPFLRASVFCCPLLPLQTALRPTIWEVSGSGTWHFVILPVSATFNWSHVFCLGFVLLVGKQCWVPFTQNWNPITVL